MSVHNAQVEISRQDIRGRRLLLDEAIALADNLLRWLREQPGCSDGSAVGRLRRRHEWFDAIELLVAAESPAAIIEAFGSAPAVDGVLRSSTTRATVVTVDGARVTLHAVTPGQFIEALQRLTGSREHNRALGAGRGTAAATEAELYGRLGHAHLPPELREGTGELEAAREGRLTGLVTVEDIRGDLHSHTTASDGVNSIEQMARAAMARGYGYLAITEHTPYVNSLEPGIGLDVGRLREHVVAIRDVAARLAPEGFTLLAGTEVDILPDGSLDYPDDVLAGVDWVVASPHVKLRQSTARATDRMVAAAAHPLVDVIGHPTGRHLIHRRPARTDMAALIAACAEHGTFLEINSNPERLDLSATNARAAREAGVPIVISTDAHEVATLANIQYGVTVARRAWLTPADVVNTRPWADVEAMRKRSRRR
jgi:DNA polymerase (family 10)